MSTGFSFAAPPASGTTSAASSTTGSGFFFGSGGNTHGFSFGLTTSGTNTTGFGSGFGATNTSSGGGFSFGTTSTSTTTSGFGNSSSGTNSGGGFSFGGTGATSWGFGTSVNTSGSTSTTGGFGTTNTSTGGFSFGTTSTSTTTSGFGNSSSGTNTGGGFSFWNTQGGFSFANTGTSTGFGNTASTGWSFGVSPSIGNTTSGANTTTNTAGGFSFADDLSNKNDSTKTTKSTTTDSSKTRKILKVKKDKWEQKERTKEMSQLNTTSGTTGGFGTTNTSTGGGFSFSDVVEPKCLDSLLKDDTYKDILFTLKDGTLKAHRCIVSMNKFLKDKIDNTKQEKDGLFEINLSSQFDKATMEHVLEYLYTKKVEEKQDWDLLSAANSLGLDSLEELCADALKEMITTSNVIKILREVKNHYIRDHCFKFIESSKEKPTLFNELTKEELLQYIVVTDSANKKEEKPKQEISLEKHLEQLFDSKEYSDLTIISKDDQKFSVHKAIVSPYFTLDGKNELKLDFEGAALGVVIEFIYKGNAKLFEDPNMLLKLRNTIEKLNNAELKKLLQKVELKMNNVIKSMKPKEVLKFCLKNGMKGDLRQSYLRLVISTATQEDLLEALCIVKDVEE